MRRTTILTILTSLVVVLTFGPSRDGPLPSLNGWSMIPGEKVYTPANLWDCIDGAAEVFLSYGFVDLNLAEYQNTAGANVRVELYRHKSTSDAFGIYSAERNPDYTFVNVGTQGYVEDGILNFLCGMYYVKITSHQPGAEGRDAMMLIARKLDEHLEQENTWPAVLALFPPEGELTNAESYIAENFLGYRCLSSAFVCQYVGESPFRAFIIERETEEQAREMTDAYLKAIHLNPTSKTDRPLTVADPHNGTVRLLRQGRYVCGVLDCKDEETAIHYLKEVQLRITEAGR